MREQKLVADDIARVEVGMSQMTYVHCAWEYRSQGVTAAQMNLSYGLAVIALDGVAFTDQYREDRLRDPRILSFIERVHAFVDPSIESRGAALRHAARVKVTTSDGRSFEKMLDDRRGSPENPLQQEDLENKFRHVTRSCLSAANIERVIALADSLDRLGDLSELINIIAAPAPAPA